MQLCASPASSAKWQQLLPVACRVQLNYCHLLLNNCIARCALYPIPIPLLFSVLSWFMFTSVSVCNYSMQSRLSSSPSLPPSPHPCASQRVEIISQYWQLLIGTSEAALAHSRCHWRHVARLAATACATCSRQAEHGAGGRGQGQGQGWYACNSNFIHNYNRTAWGLLGLLAALIASSLAEITSPLSTLLACPSPTHLYFKHFAHYEY